VEDSMEAQPDERQSSSEKVEIEAYLEAPVQSNSENSFCTEWSAQTVRLATAGVRNSIADRYAIGVRTLSMKLPIRGRIFQVKLPARTGRPEITTRAPIIGLAEVKVG